MGGRLVGNVGKGAVFKCGKADAAGTAVAVNQITLIWACIFFSDHPWLIWNAGPKAQGGSPAGRPTSVQPHFETTRANSYQQRANF